MTGLEWTLLALVLVFGFYMAWNIGANDVANAMGTSVGSRALTLRKAVIVAAVFEFSGAFLVGSHVSDTLSKGLFDPLELNTLYPASEFGPQYAAHILACGMIAALLAAGTWLLIATYAGFPVSTTHSIVGAVVGFGFLALGPALVDWGEVTTIMCSWVLSPLLSGAVAYCLFRVVLSIVFYQRDQVAAAQKVAPYLTFTVLVVLIGVVAFKGMQPMWKRLNIDPFDTHVFVMFWSAALLLGVTGMWTTRGLVMAIHPPALASADGPRVTPDVYRAVSKAMMHLRRVRDRTEGEMSQQAERLLNELGQLHTSVHQEFRFGTDSAALQHVERIFVYLQVLTACSVAFSHGANDVANAIGPLSAGYQAIHTSQVALKASVPAWALLVGGAGIVVGLAMWGWRVIRTVGERITELTPSRGFCAEFAAALVILIASVTGIPVSTTHTLVGAVLGVGLARGLGALNLTVFRDIFVSWIITVPVGAVLCLIFYYILKFLLLDLAIIPA